MMSCQFWNKTCVSITDVSRQSCGNGYDLLRPVLLRPSPTQANPTLARLCCAVCAVCAVCVVVVCVVCVCVCAVCVWGVWAVCVSTPKHLNTKTPEHLNTSTPKHLNTRTPKNPKDLNPRPFVFNRPSCGASPAESRRCST